MIGACIYCCFDLTLWQATYLMAVAYALQNGCVVVVAAGNDNDYTDSHCPAHITGCITVSAVNRNKQRASFSNYGSAVDIAAPGMDITSAVPGGGTASLNGTSMATPHVSAAAAMLLCDDPSLSYSAVESMLRDAATDLGSSGWDAYFGAGFLRAHQSFLAHVRELVAESGFAVQPVVIGAVSA